MSTTEPTFVYVGTDVSGVESSAADRANGGVFVFEFDQTNGRLQPIQRVELDRPSYLALSPSGPTLYAACRGGSHGDDSSSVVSCAIDAGTGKLSPIDHAGVPAQPVYISLDRTESFALLACAFAGSVAVVPLGPDGTVSDPVCVVVHDDGPSIISQGITSATLGQRRWSSDSVLPHSVAVDPSNAFALVCDVGLNRIAVYQFDVDTGSLTPNTPAWAQGAPIAADLPTRNPAVWESPRGAGPRHMCFNQSGRRLYVVNETSSTVSTFSYDGESGILELLQDISTLPANWTKINSGSDVHLHPGGRFLYVTNRGHDSVAIFAVSSADGTLTLLGHVQSGGIRPRTFTVSPDGEWLLVANVSSNAISAIRVDGSTGQAEVVHTDTAVPSPTCVKTLVLGA
jgi:6-phosphogluconolactonase